MQEAKTLPRLLSIKDIQKYYIQDMGYRKLKCFLISYIPYQKIGRQYFFSKKKLEELMESECSTEFQLRPIDYGCGKK